MSIVLGAALLAGAVVLFLLQPMITGTRAPLEGEGDEETEAEARRKVTLRALRDVEYDYHTGKLDDEDYRALRRELSGEALEALDALQRERQAEALALESGGAPSGDLEAEIARVRAGLRSGLTCPACGEVMEQDSRFCTHCGGELPAGGAGDRETTAGDRA